ncbi:MAG: hypothetical protein ACRBBS_09700 [Thalassovita sp.]
MSGTTGKDMLTEARGILASAAFFDNADVLWAVGTIARLGTECEVEMIKSLQIALECGCECGFGLTLLYLRRFVARLEKLDPAECAMRLKNMCWAYGVWMMPLPPATYRPDHYEISLFGLTAAGTTPEQVSENWLRAARAHLECAGVTA